MYAKAWLEYKHFDRLAHQSTEKKNFFFLKGSKTFIAATQHSASEKKNYNPKNLAIIHIILQVYHFFGSSFNTCTASAHQLEKSEATYNPTNASTIILQVYQVGLQF